MSSNIKIVELTESNQCAFCKNALGGYCCPKCNLLYCTVACYQSEQHVSCSESFYKSLILEQIDSTEDESTEKIKEILEREFHNKNLLSDNEEENQEEIDSDDDDDEDPNGADALADDIAERLNGINLDDCEKVWENLTEDERNDFEKFLLSGDVSKFIEMWVPWWTTNHTSPLIDIDELEQIKNKCPAVSEDIKKFQEISSKPPASCVEHNLINIIASYVFTMRYFNGGQEDFPKEVSMLIYTLSLNLSKNANFDSFNQAIGSVRDQCINGKDLGIVTDEENLDMIKTDVHCIMHGPHATDRKFYILSCLSHVKQLLLDGNKVKEGDNSKQGEFYKKFTAQQNSVVDQVDKSALKKASKKIDYFLSFINDVYNV